MLIYLHGADSFLAREAILSLKKKYLEKNPTGSELIEIDCDGELPNWADLKAVPLFATSRLIIIRRAGELTVGEQDSLAGMLTDLPESSIVVVWDAKPLKPNSPLSLICDNDEHSEKFSERSGDKSTKKISVEPLAGPSLTAWIKKQATGLGIEASPQLSGDLIKQYGSDLWAIQTDLATRPSTGLPSTPFRVNGVNQGDLSAELSGWGQAKSEKPFILFDDVRARNWPSLKQHLINALERGEALEMNIGSLAAAVRQSIGDDNLRRQLVDILSDVDLALKSGLIEAADAVALLVYYLPESQKRVQWEELCLAIA